MEALWEYDGELKRFLMQSFLMPNFQQEFIKILDFLKEDGRLKVPEFDLEISDRMLQWQCPDISNYFKGQ